MNTKQGSHISWLISCPCNDGNFKNHLKSANIEELKYVLSVLTEKGNKTKIKVINSEIRKRTKKERGNTMITNIPINKLHPHPDDKLKRFWVLCPRRVEVPYMNVYRMADARKGVRFEIIADFSNKDEAINKAENIINQGKYALIHDSDKHIDFYKKNNWKLADLK